MSLSERERQILAEIEVHLRSGPTSSRPGSRSRARVLQRPATAVPLVPVAMLFFLAGVRLDNIYGVVLALVGYLVSVGSAAAWLHATAESRATRAALRFRRRFSGTFR